MIDDIRKLIQKERWTIKTLEEIAREIFKGSGVDKEYLGKGNHPVIRNNISSLPRKVYECIEFVDPNNIKNKKYGEYGDIFVNTVGSKNSLGRNCVYLGKGKVIAGNSVIVVKHDEDPNFLSWALSSRGCRKQMWAIGKKYVIPHLLDNQIAQMKVPIPAKHVQVVVAKKLDQLFGIVQDFEEKMKIELEYRREKSKYYKKAIADIRNENVIRGGRIYREKSADILRKLLAAEKELKKCLEKELEHRQEQFEYYKELLIWGE